MPGIGRFFLVYCRIDLLREACGAEGACERVTSGPMAWLAEPEVSPARYWKILLTYFRFKSSLLCKYIKN